MSTQVFGCSDDLIEFDGDIHEEEPGGDKPTLLVFSDGTILSIVYGKSDLAVWAITKLVKGHLLSKIDICLNEDANRYSDTAYFDDGLLWVKTTSNWRNIKCQTAR